MRTVLSWVGLLLTACALPVLAESEQPMLVEGVAPVYPLVAVYSATAGEVHVRVSIDKTGSVTTSKLVRGHRLLASAAEEASRKWRFTPGGDREATIVFSFRILPKGTPESELATRFRAPLQIEVRRVIPEASTNSDPAADPPRRKSK
ncbi:MAG: TonB family protein [Bryobacteraceae bacterium]